jgi:class 3 adenylate cyclase
MSDIRQWLDGLGLARYAGQLEANDVDLETLEELSDQDLKDLGVTSLGHRRKLLKAIRERAPARGESLRPPPRHIAERILSDRSALEGERKQVTVLFADVAGFTTLSERLDPEAVHDLMDDCFAVLGKQVHRYEGTINLYAGNGMMALFGAPIAHEDHALRAAHAALDIQASLADFGAGVEDLRALRRDSGGDRRQLHAGLPAAGVDDPGHPADAAREPALPVADVMVEEREEDARGAVAGACRRLMSTAARAGG